jgi:hypothetical protein
MSEHDEMVSQLERELRFFPVQNEHPKKMTKEQIGHSNEKGIIVVGSDPEGHWKGIQRPD